MRDPKTAPLVVRAFEMRAEGTSIMRIKAFLAEHGTEKSYMGVEKILYTRTARGEIHFGKYVNERRPRGDRVRRSLAAGATSQGQPRPPGQVRPPAGALGILRCATCGARLS